jgi:hypothetical protein
MDTITDGWSDVIGPEFWVVSDVCFWNKANAATYIQFIIRKQHN